MGKFRIVIDCEGSHGQDRTKGDGDEVNFFVGGQNNPDAAAKIFVDTLRKEGLTGVVHAKIVHFPGEPGQVTDNLITGKRKGHF